MTEVHPRLSDSLCSVCKSTRESRVRKRCSQFSSNAGIITGRKRCERHYENRCGFCCESRHCCNEHLIDEEDAKVVHQETRLRMQHEPEIEVPTNEALDGCLCEKCKPTPLCWCAGSISQQERMNEIKSFSKEEREVFNSRTYCRGNCSKCCSYGRQNGRCAGRHRGNPFEDPDIFCLKDRRLSDRNMPGDYPLTHVEGNLFSRKVFDPFSGKLRDVFYYNNDGKYILRTNEGVYTLGVDGRTHIDECGYRY